MSSLPGARVQSPPGCHSQMSPVAGLVAANPPSGSGTTAFSPRPSGATTHPTHVRDGTVPAASTSKTSMASRSVWRTTYSVWVSSSPGRMLTPCARNCSVVMPGHPP